jgi:uncharacterized protein (DUF1330 family)
VLIARLRVRVLLGSLRLTHPTFGLDFIFLFRVFTLCAMLYALCDFLSEGEIMAAYLIGHITVKDPIQWKIYTEGVATSLKPYGAEIIFRGKRASVLCGEHSYQNAVVIKFPDQPTLQQWHDSNAYQELIPVRDKAADVLLISYDA